jgi:hypothetical protein
MRDQIADLVERVMNLPDSERSLRSGLRRHLRLQQFIHEHLSLAIRLPRCSGHTSAAAVLWKRYNAVYIAPQWEMCRYFAQYYLERRLTNDMPVYSAEPIARDVCRYVNILEGLGHPLDLIILDVYSQVRERDKPYLQMFIGELVMRNPIRAVAYLQ